MNVAASNRLDAAPEMCIAFFKTGIR
jgi:hypothetical protein